jgi:glycosyltransferase involved in cell wall biosynthesis
MFNVSDMLKKHGHQVIPFCMKHEKNENSIFSNYFVENIDYENVMKENIFEKLRKGFKAIYNFEAKSNLLKLIEKENPDLAHLHKINNTLTPSILHTLKKKNIPVVQTLHDYRIVCPSYSMYNPNTYEICEACKGHKYYNPILKKCQKSSLLVGFNIAFESYFYHLTKTYQKNIDLLISPSMFLMKKVIEFGIEKDKIVHVPNFLKPKEYTPNYCDSDFFLFFGRLEKHKGIKTLLDAMKQVKNLKLYITGEGSDQNFLKNYVEKNKIENVTFFGFIPRKKLTELIKLSLFTVIPSEWYEPFGMTILESYALGKSVIGSKIGGIQELIENKKTGMLFRSGNAEDLADKINFLSNNRELTIEMGKYARIIVEKKYNEKIHYQELMKIYNRIL